MEKKDTIIIKKYALTNENISSFKSMTRLFETLGSIYHEFGRRENNSDYERRYTTGIGGEIILTVNKGEEEKGTLEVRSSDREIKFIEEDMSLDKLLKLEQI
jgi:hypothetical protein